MKHLIKTQFMLITTLFALSGCHILSKSNSAAKIESTPTVVEIKGETKEVIQVVYVEKSENKINQFCETTCSDIELESQLDNFAKKPSVLRSYHWLKGVAANHSDKIQSYLDKIEMSYPSSVSLLRGIFFSIPKTGSRDTALALENINNYPLDINSTDDDSIFLGLLISNLQERKQLIEERSTLRQKANTLQKERETQRSVAIKAQNQLQKLKEIERSMLNDQGRTKQYKVSE